MSWCIEWWLVSTKPWLNQILYVTDRWFGVLSARRLCAVSFNQLQNYRMYGMPFQFELLFALCIPCVVVHFFASFKCFVFVVRTVCACVWSLAVPIVLTLNICAHHCVYALFVADEDITAHIFSYTSTKIIALFAPNYQCWCCVCLCVFFVFTSLISFCFAVLYCVVLCRAMHRLFLVCWLLCWSF